MEDSTAPVILQGDNLHFLRGMNSETVQLIATDPPFNKGSDFHALHNSKAAGASFSDRWTWQEDVQEEWVEQIQQEWPGVWWAIQAARTNHSESMGAFLCWMGIRIFEMHRILKKDGAIYLQCDTTSNHYLKSLLDAVFGHKNFRNEIVWKRHSAHNDARRKFGAVHDTILYYAKSHHHVHQPQYTAYSRDFLKKNYRKKDKDGRSWGAGDITISGSLSGGHYEYEYKGRRNKWSLPQTTMEKLDQEGRLYFTQHNIYKKRYLDEMKGMPVSDIWIDVGKIGASSRERTGYPTQKPISLYKRMIHASSAPGDMVLDPFAGCGTTLVAAEQLGRKWIGMELNPDAVQLISQRFRDMEIANRAISCP